MDDADPLTPARGTTHGTVGGGIARAESVAEMNGFQVDAIARARAAAEYASPSPGAGSARTHPGPPLLGSRLGPGTPAVSPPPTFDGSAFSGGASASASASGGYPPDDSPAPVSRAPGATLGRSRSVAEVRDHRHHAEHHHHHHHPHDPAGGSSGASGGLGGGFFHRGATGTGTHHDRFDHGARGAAIANSDSVADLAAMARARQHRVHPRDGGASGGGVGSDSLSGGSGSDDQAAGHHGGVSVADARITEDAAAARKGAVAGEAMAGSDSSAASAAPASLFGPGRFPRLPSPRRDRGAGDYRLLRELGRGLCGTVYLGEEKDTGRIVAFKVMRKTKLVDVGEAHHASEERRLHERVSAGPFVNRLLASFQDPWALFLVLEYAPCGDLFQAMNYHGLPSRQDAVVYTAQVATALEHLHGLGYVYRDLKPENILLHPHGSVQLADFGMAKRLESRGRRTYTICGTAQYMSPEVLLHRGCHFEADLWALGIFVFELVTGDTPFSGVSGSRQELYRKLMRHDPDAMAMPAAVDRETAALVRALLRNEERSRLGADGRWEALYAHPWFAGVDAGAVRRGDVTPRLSPRRRNVVVDPALRRALEKGDVPWRRGSVVEDPDVLAVFEKF